MRRSFSNVSIIFNRDAIDFPKGYFFRTSPLHKERIIRAGEIDEVNLNTFPPSLVRRGNEVIFVKPILAHHLELFARENDIPVRNRTDIWSHISRPFLDATFTAEEVRQSENLLALNGIDKDELREIRRKASYTYFLNIFYWESVYLGLFDYLSWTYITPGKYQWAMKIALRRNF